MTIADIAARRDAKLVRANGTDIAYTEAGDGPPLILLHGALASTGAAWAGSPVAFVDHMHTLGKHFRVIAPDTRGSGATVHPGGPATFDVLADDVAALIQALQLDRPMIAGFSEGGATATYVALRYPDIVRALVNDAGFDIFDPHAMAHQGVRPMFGGSPDAATADPDAAEQAFQSIPPMAATFATMKADYDDAQGEGHWRTYLGLFFDRAVAPVSISISHSLAWRSCQETNAARPPALECAPDVGERPHGVVEEHQSELADEAIERAGGEVVSLCISDHELRVGDHRGLRSASGQLHERLRQVDTDDAFGTRGGGKRRRARPAANVEHDPVRVGDGPLQEGLGEGFELAVQAVRMVDEVRGFPRRGLSFICSHLLPIHQKIRVHSFYCVLALSIARLLRRQAAKAGYAMSVRELLATLAGIQETVLLYPSTGGRPRARRMTTETNTTQARLYELFGLDAYAPRKP